MLKRLKYKDGKVIPDDYYTIDNTAGFDHPVLHPTEILYRKWKKGDNFPNGIIKEVYAYNHKNIRTVFFELVQYSAVEKHITIDYSGCR